MRTLVDVFSGERGYVRIYAERDGFSYQLNTYSPPPVMDLFEQMDGYSTAYDACAAAHFQLSSLHQDKLRRKKRKR
jgi:hypothetical protein